MKTYEEKTQSVFQKMEGARAMQRKRIRTMKRVITPVLGVCFVALIGFVGWQKGVFQKLPMIPPSGESDAIVPDSNGVIQQEEKPKTTPTQSILPPEEENQDASAPTMKPETLVNSDTADAPEETENHQNPPQPHTGGNVTEGDTNTQEGSGVFIPTGDSGLIQWGNKTVSVDLVKALEKAPADRVFDILAHPYIDYGFVYEGRTLAKFYSDMCDERNLPELLTQLLKEGDSLKYGTALYEGSAPNGEKWARSLYEERIAYYGAAILNKYIVEGEFLRSLVERDLENAKTAKEATKAYKSAYAAYFQHLVDTLQISASADVKGTGGILLHMTAGEFRSFTPSHIEAWSFSSSNYGSE